MKEEVKIIYVFREMRESVIIVVLVREFVNLV